MRLNHINLCSSDVAALQQKLERHFGYQTVDSGTVPDVPGLAGAGTPYAMLIGEDGSNIVISQIDARDGSAYPAQFHFGLIQETPEAVHAKHEELVAAGLAPGKVNGPFEVLGARWTAFSCPLGDGLEIEINHRTRSELLDR